MTQGNGCNNGKNSRGDEASFAGRRSLNDTATYGPALICAIAPRDERCSSQQRESTAPILRPNRLTEILEILDEVERILEDTSEGIEVSTSVDDSPGFHIAIGWEKCEHQDSKGAQRQ